jgi:hypothetical protein
MRETAGKFKHGVYVLENNGGNVRRVGHQKVREHKVSEEL